MLLSSLTCHRTDYWQTRSWAYSGRSSCRIFSVIRAWSYQVGMALLLVFPKVIFFPLVASIADPPLLWVLTPRFGVASGNRLVVNDEESPGMLVLVSASRVLTTSIPELFRQASGEPLYTEPKFLLSAGLKKPRIPTLRALPQSRIVLYLRPAISTASVLSIPIAKKCIITTFLYQKMLL